MSKLRARREFTYEDRHLGPVRVRRLSGGRVRKATMALRAMDIDAVAREVSGDDHPMAELRQAVESCLWGRELLRQAVIDAPIRSQFGLDDVSMVSLDSDDSEAFHRLVGAVWEMSGCPSRGSGS